MKKKNQDAIFNTVTKIISFLWYHILCCKTSTLNNQSLDVRFYYNIHLEIEFR